MEIFEKFQIEVKEDTRLDDMNIKEKQLMLPGIKHKWAARIINFKIERNTLIKERKRLIKESVEALSKSGAPPSAPQSALEKKVAASEVIVSIDRKLEELELLLEYLEKVESIMRSFTFDIKNSVELLKLETL